MRAKEENSSTTADVADLADDGVGALREDVDTVTSYRFPLQPLGGKLIGVRGSDFMRDAARHRPRRRCAVRERDP
jgi:hypothetical protein